jgi:hypothetical protein
MNYPCRGCRKPTPKIRSRDRSTSGNLAALKQRRDPVATPSALIQNADGWRLNRHSKRRAVLAYSAICVQKLDDSLNSAIRITYRISLRSSSLREPRYPLLRVVFQFFFQLHSRFSCEKARIEIYWFQYNYVQGVWVEKRSSGSSVKEPQQVKTVYKCTEGFWDFEETC